MFKNMILVFLFDMLLNLSFKMTTILTNIARTTASTSKFIVFCCQETFIYLFVLSRKVFNISNDIARKYGNVTIKDFRNKKK